jgi:hypothetical protein
MDPTAKDLPLLVESPGDDYLLPTESVIWDGHSLSLFERKVPVNGQLSIHLGTFQRAAQAATLLNKAHRWEEMTRQRDILPRVVEFEALDKEIRCVLDALLAQSPRWDVFCDSFAMCMR